MDHNINFKYAEFIFQLLEREIAGCKNTYEWALKELRKGRHYLSPEIKNKMVETLKQVANSFEKINSLEFDIINRFKKDLESIGSDHYLK